MTDYEPLIRPAIRRALSDHAPAGKTYDSDGRVKAKVCRCGHQSEGVSMAARTRHLEDVTVAATVKALAEDARRKQAAARGDDYASLRPEAGG